MKALEIVGRALGRGLGLIPGLGLFATVDLLPTAGLLLWDAPRTLAVEAPLMDQFADLRPTDWAYQALAQLRERYGCVAGYSEAREGRQGREGRYGGEGAIGRYEAAAQLTACLDRITETTDELKRLLREFELELALLKGRVGSQDAKLSALESIQFSPTTTLSGLATFVVGGVNNSPIGSGVTFNYDIQLELATSFTGKDRLTTILRSGNFEPASNAFGAGLSTLEVAYAQEGGNDHVFVDKLYYSFPFGKGFSAVIGARVEQIDLLPLWPSVYPDDTILDVLFLNGAPLAYNKNYGTGFGLSWQANGLSLNANYVAVNGTQSTDGLFSANSAGTATVQVGYQQSQWAIAAIYSYLQAGVDPPGSSAFVAYQLLVSPTNAFGLSGYWQPVKSGWIPSISLGYGFNSSSDVGDLQASQSWLVGLQWTDVFAKGNAFGTAIGAPAYATIVRSGDPESTVLAWEAWYKFQVTDAIAITPAIFYLSNPGEDVSPGGQNQFGALIKTTFQF